MAWFFRKKDNEEINALQLNFSSSVDALKYDVNGIKSTIILNNQNIYQWLQFLYKRIQEQDQLIKDLRLEIRVPQQTAQVDAIEHLSEVLKEKLAPKPVNSFKEKIIQKIAKNSKSFLKNTIISLINKYQRISAQELKEMVVDEQKLTTKSTFYRIIKEIEQLSEISIIQQGKEKIFLSKLYARP